KQPPGAVRAHWHRAGRRFRARARPAGQDPGRGAFPLRRQRCAVGQRGPQTRGGYPVTPTRTPRLGFRVLGSAQARRRLIDFDAPFAAYAACDPKAEVEREAYLSAFTYGPAFRRHLAETGSTKGYDGPCWTPWVWFDLDGEDLDATLADARRLAA